MRIRRLEEARYSEGMEASWMAAWRTLRRLPKMPLGMLEDLTNWANRSATATSSRPRVAMILFRLVYMFGTDLHMTKAQHTRHEVLALAGHKLDLRLVLVD